MQTLAEGLRLQMDALDYVLLALYFITVLGVGLAARRSIRNSVDFFLSGRSLPAWVTGLAFISANLGALEILGMAANGAKYGIMTVHYYWIGAGAAVPAVAVAAPGRAAGAGGRGRRVAVLLTRSAADCHAWKSCWQMWRPSRRWPRPRRPWSSAWPALSFWPP
ncbi:sodium:solute symporter family transporter [Dactylosporangium sp. CA-233914]|uniref:sodium:solute symporter family transporter n=1 Tax=Dactylosporangium sp. CA-233914 TaxID=3239934 RepID=UPI003D8C638A